MVAKIEFYPNEKELTLPLITLTKSINGKTGTATFLFLKPNIFEKIYLISLPIQKMSLIFDKKEIITEDISIFFLKGKPIILKSILLFKNSTEWFEFFNFMKIYSKETGLIFEEKKNKNIL